MAKYIYNVKDQRWAMSLAVTFLACASWLDPLMMRWSLWISSVTWDGSNIEQKQINAMDWFICSFYFQRTVSIITSKRTSQAWTFSPKRKNRVHQPMVVLSYRTLFVYQSFPWFLQWCWNAIPLLSHILSFSLCLKNWWTMSKLI